MKVLSRKSLLATIDKFNEAVFYGKEWREESDEKTNSQMNWQRQTRVLAGIAGCCAILVLGGCGTWETSSSVNVFGRIAHDSTNDYQHIQTYAETVDNTLMRNP